MLSDGILPYFGMFAALLAACSFLPYIIGMWRGQTKPLRSAWLIWSVLACLSAFSNLVEGASASAWFVCIQAAATVLIFAFSFRCGMGGFVNALDGLVIALAIIGLGLWWVTDSAVYALGISIGVSALGGWVTLSKAYHAPETENGLCWGLSACASGLALLSIGQFDPVLLAYPAYLLVLYTGILTAMTLGRRHQHMATVVFVSRRPHKTPY